MGSHRIASLLNSKGLKTHNGSKFQSNTINRILKNRLYCGYIVVGDTTSPFLKNLQIVDENVFESIQDMIKQRMVKNAERTIPLRTLDKTLLAGNVFCAHCGGHFIVTRYQDRYLRKDGTEYKIDQLKYTCYHKTRKLNNCDGQTSYTAEKIDKAVINVLDELFEKIKYTPKDKALEKRYKAQVPACNSKYKKAQDEVERLNTQLRSLKMEIGKALVGDSQFTANQLSEAIKATQERINERVTDQEKIKSELENKKIAISKLDYYYNQFIGWANEFHNLPLAQQKMIACQLIRDVSISRGYNVNIEFDMNYKQFCTGM